MTAVKWLAEQILTKVQNYKDGDIETESEPFKHEYVNKYIGIIDLSEFVNQAKQIEKQQIMKAVYDSMGTNIDPNIGRAELYYNETYKNTKE